MRRGSNRELRPFVLLAIVMAAGPSVAIAQGAKADSVVISLRPVSQVQGTDILISDIALVECRDRNLKSRVESLDLADTPRSGETITIPASLIEFRMRLAGVDPRRVSIRGERVAVSTVGDSLGQEGMRTALATSARVNKTLTAAGITSSSGSTQKLPAQSKLNFDRQTLEEAIIDEAKRCVRDQLPWKEDDIGFRLAQSISREIQAIEDIKPTSICGELRGSGAAVGRVTIDVTVEGEDHSTTVIPVAFDVRHYADVVATTRPISRGHEIQRDDLYVHRWDVTGLADYCTDPEKVIGRAVRRPISALQIVHAQDVDSSAAANQARAVVIKRSDRVKMIARIGDLNITVAGEAQQDGRVGEMIRIQNVESKAVVQGRVLKAGEVEIMD